MGIEPFVLEVIVSKYNKLSRNKTFEKTVPSHFGNPWVPQRCKRYLKDTQQHFRFLKGFWVHEYISDDFKFLGRQSQENGEWLNGNQMWKIDFTDRGMFAIFRDGNVSQSITLVQTEISRQLGWTDNWLQGSKPESWGESKLDNLAGNEWKGAARRVREMGSRWTVKVRWWKRWKNLGVSMWQSKRKKEY